MVEGSSGGGGLLVRVGLEDAGVSGVGTTDALAGVLGMIICGSVGSVGVAGRLGGSSGLLGIATAGCAISVVIGLNWRSAFRFLVVTLPEPSIFTQYWSNGSTSVTVPVLSHLFG